MKATMQIEVNIPEVSESYREVLVDYVQEAMERLGCEVLSINLDAPELSYMKIFSKSDIVDVEFQEVTPNEDTKESGESVNS